MMVKVGSMVRSWQGKPDGVGLNQIGLVLLAGDGLKDAPAWSKSGASQLAALDGKK